MEARLNYGKAAPGVLRAMQGLENYNAESGIEPELRELYGANLVLVRPDLHVAWRGEEPPADAGDLWDTLRGARSAVPA